MNMRKSCSTLVLVLLFFGAKSEIWFDLGIKGAYAPGVFINSNVFSTSTQRLKYNHGFFAGGKIGVNFGLSHALVVEGLYTQTRQTINSTFTGLDNTVSLNTVDIPLMYRNNTDEGGYAEIGPQLSIVLGAEQTGAGVSNDVTSDFLKSRWGLALGFGQYVGGGDAFGFDIGFRFAYTFSDILAAKAATATTSPIYQPQSPTEISEFNYSKTSRLYVGIAIEADFNLGYFTKGAACSKRTKFKMF